MKMNLPVNPNVDSEKWYEIKARKIKDNNVHSTFPADFDPLASSAVFTLFSSAVSSASKNAVPSTSDTFPTSDAIVL